MLLMMRNGVSAVSLDVALPQLMTGADVMEVFTPFIEADYVVQDICSFVRSFVRSCIHTYNR